MNLSVQVLKETLPNVLSIFSIVYLYYSGMFDCLKIRLGYNFDPYRHGKCNQIQREVMARFYISCTCTCV